MTLRLLVADDSVTIQKMVHLAFGEEDARIEAVSSGDAAIEALDSFRPDIVLADVCMPGLNGYEVCERIRENAEFSGTPVILLAGTFEPYDAMEAERVGSNGYLTKPFDTSELIEMVHSLVQVDAMSAGEGQTDLVSGVGREKLVAHAPGCIAPRVWESFTGGNQILQIFDPKILQGAPSMPVLAGPKAQPQAKPDAKEVQFTEDMINQVVEKVVRKMSPDVIREVAWEVVPELSEVLIRRALEEQSSRN